MLQQGQQPASIVPQHGTERRPPSLDGPCNHLVSAQNAPLQIPRELQRLACHAAISNGAKRAKLMDQNSSVPLAQTDRHAPRHLHQLEDRARTIVSGKAHAISESPSWDAGSENQHGRGIPHAVRQRLRLVGIQQTSLEWPEER